MVVIIELLVLILYYQYLRGYYFIYVKLINNGLFNPLLILNYLYVMTIGI